MPPGSEGIIALDTWQGSRTPFRDPRRRGAFTGLTLSHGRAHLYRALLESVAYGGRQVTAQATRAAGVISVSARARTAARAARLASAVAQQVVVQNRLQAAATLAPTRDYLKGQLDQLQRRG